MTKDTKRKESMFLSNDEGKPLCTECWVKPIVCETNRGCLCLDCAFQMIESFGVENIEPDESMLVCDRELEIQINA